MERRILHADFNSFYASVACLLEPSLWAYPVAVAGDPEQRHGIILAKNELAKRFGVRTGEALWEARKKCPRLVTVKPDYPAYQRFSALGREIYAQYSDRVESFGLDENWLDVSGSTNDFMEAERLAQQLRVRIRDELGITVSVGVASNKVFAKLGSDIKKPDAVTVISPENYRRVAWPLPARELLYVGRVTEGKLRKYGILTIGELANTPEAFLRAQFGKGGSMLHAFANGLDASPVTYTHETRIAKSVGNGVTAPRDLTCNEDAYLTIVMLCESVAARLRESGMRAGTVQLAVRDAGLYSFMRQRKLQKPTNLAMELAREAMALFTEHYGWQVPVRSLTITASELLPGSAPAQLSLFENEETRLRAERAERAVDGIRARFGYHAIGRALFLTDSRIGRLNPREENTVHPVGYLQNGGMAEATGKPRQAGGASAAGVGG